MDFCRCYKVDGKPVNTSVQADAWEFFNNVFDELEGKLKPSTQDAFLIEIFGGQLANQFIGAADNCSHRREVPETFRTISVDIKDKSTLHEALKLFVQGEIVNGVFCEQCQQNVDTMKRCVIKDLPNILVIHLKRFDFDYQTMTRIKLNSSLSFPMDLNVEPYTKEGVARQEGEPLDEIGESLGKSPEDYQYELTGIVVHSGSMDSGHYYSYIKGLYLQQYPLITSERIPLKGNECKWFEFNDTSVTLWDPKRLEADCFGSNEATTKDVFGTRKNYGKGAYLLVYQKKGIEVCLDATAKLIYTSNYQLCLLRRKFLPKRAQREREISAPTRKVKPLKPSKNRESLRQRQQLRETQASGALARAPPLPP